MGANKEGSTIRRKWNIVDGLYFHAPSIEIDWGSQCVPQVQSGLVDSAALGTC